MQKHFFLSVLLMGFISLRAQTTAMQFSGSDCNGDTVNCYADLDSGKCVVLFFYMPNCGSCPPPAQKIQTMCDNINAMYPGMVKGYAFPYQNSTTCSYCASWVSSNSLSSLFAPMDSGADYVAYYGGFGMPTVVLLGGTDYRVLFSTLSFSTSDTTIMRDSILALVGGSSGIRDVNPDVSNISIYPNPTSDEITAHFNLKDDSHVKLELVDITGKSFSILLDEKQNKGIVEKRFSIADLSKGNYFIQITVNGESSLQKLTVN